MKHVRIVSVAAAGATPAITPDASLKPDQQSLLDSLKNKTGADFDTAYAESQVTAHQQALDLLHHYAVDSSVPALKTFTDEAIPIVTAHLNMAKGLKP
jgi:putative membrane protein